MAKFSDQPGSKICGPTLADFIVAYHSYASLATVSGTKGHARNYCM